MPSISWDFLTYCVTVSLVLWGIPSSRSRKWFSSVVRRIPLGESPAQGPTRSQDAVSSGVGAVKLPLSEDDADEIWAVAKAAMGPDATLARALPVAISMVALAPPSWSFATGVLLTVVAGLLVVAYWKLPVQAMIHFGRTREPRQQRKYGISLYQVMSIAIVSLAFVISS